MNGWTDRWMSQWESNGGAGKRLAQDLLFYVAPKKLFISYWFLCHPQDGQGVTKHWCKGLSFFTFLHNSRGVSYA